MKRLTIFLITVIFLQLPSIQAVDSKPIKESQQKTEKKASKQTIDHIILNIVAETIKKAPEKIDIKKALITQGADELMIVEIVMMVEDEFNIEIPDKDYFGKNDKVNKKLSVKIFVEIVSRIQKNK